MSVPDSTIDTGIGAIVFDCDGVLVDSYVSVERSWRRWAAEYGCDPEDVLGTVSGRRAVDVVAAFLPPAERARGKDRIDTIEVEDAPSVRQVAGAGGLLRSLPRDRWAVVTSATRALAMARLAASGLPAPPLLITADDVRDGKPDPEGYCAAIDALGGGPAVVVEDGASGIAAGRAAGAAYVVGVGEPARGFGPDTAVPDLRWLAWHAGALLVTPPVWSPVHG